MSEMNALAEAAAIRKRDATDVAIPTSDAPSSASPGQERPRKIRKSDLPREERLLQNRQAASEARRRKREMVEDLQRSVAFFSKSNASLKSRNAELERQILIARQRIACGDTQGGVASAAGAAGLNNVMLKSNIKDEEKEAMAARFAATQAMVRIIYSAHRPIVQTDISNILNVCCVTVQIHGVPPSCGQTSRHNF